jgi:hypothetical protein
MKTMERISLSTVTIGLWKVVSYEESTLLSDSAGGIDDRRTSPFDVNVTLPYYYHTLDVVEQFNVKGCRHW